MLTPLIYLYIFYLLFLLKRAIYFVEELIVQTWFLIIKFVSVFLSHQSFKR